MENHRIWLNNLTKLPVARKLVVRHTKLVCLTASFNYFFQNACIVYRHAYLNTLLFLHSAFKLSMVKLFMVIMPLKGVVGGCALNGHGNYIVDHRKSWKNHGIVFLNFLGNPASTLQLSHSSALI